MKTGAKPAIPTVIAVTNILLHSGIAIYAAQDSRRLYTEEQGQVTGGSEKAHVPLVSMIGTLMTSARLSAGRISQHTISTTHTQHTLTQVRMKEMCPS